MVGTAPLIADVSAISLIVSAFQKVRHLEIGDTDRPACWSHEPPFVRGAREGHRLNDWKPVAVTRFAVSGFMFRFKVMS
jgi:hypothetical protein